MLPFGPRLALERKYGRLSSAATRPPGLQPSRNFQPKRLESLPYFLSVGSALSSRVRLTSIGPRACEGSGLSIGRAPYGRQIGSPLRGPIFSERPLPSFFTCLASPVGFADQRPCPGALAIPHGWSPAVYGSPSQQLGRRRTSMAGQCQGTKLADSDWEPTVGRWALRAAKRHDVLRALQTVSAAKAGPFGDGEAASFATLAKLALLLAKGGQAIRRAAANSSPTGRIAAAQTASIGSACGFRVERGAGKSGCVLRWRNWPVGTQLGFSRSSQCRPKKLLPGRYAAASDASALQWPGRPPTADLLASALASRA